MSRRYHLRCWFGHLDLLWSAFLYTIGCCVAVVELPAVLMEVIYLNNYKFWLSAFLMVFNPLFWNVVARYEHRKRFLTNLFGSAKAGCIFLAVAIFHLMLLRSRCFQLVLESQPVLSDCLPVVSSPLVDWFGIGLILLGFVLVVTSFFALGFYGTYLGDYFGILMEAKVTSFPFNVTAHPMYYGSFLESFGTAMWYRSPAGILLSLVLLFSYLVAIRFEEPFTAEIYRQKRSQDSKKSR